MPISKRITAIITVLLLLKFPNPDIFENVSLDLTVEDDNSLI